MTVARLARDENAPIPTLAPEGFREALAELVTIGLSVARMVGRVAEAEAVLAAAALPGGAVEACSAMAGSLAEAIEADRAAAAAHEAQRSVVARAEAVAGAFARVSRSVRLTVLLAERLDRGWARRGAADDRAAMTRRQVVRGVSDAIARESDGAQPERLSEALVERLERLDVESGIGDRPAEDLIREICRDLGLDPARMTVRAPLSGAPGQELGRNTRGAAEPPPAAESERGWEAPPRRRRPDG